MDRVRFLTHKGKQILFTDVTDSYRLGRWRRLLTDVGGFYFNLIFALGVFVTYAIWRQDWILVAVASVLGNPGPGSANLIPGVVTARHEGVPVLTITSQHRLQIAYPSTPATFQGQDPLELPTAVRCAARCRSIDWRCRSP